MAFTKQTETLARMVKDVSFETLHKKIQEDTELEFSQNAFAPGSRILPVGQQSPFMIVGASPTDFDVNSFYEDDDHQKIITSLCEASGLDQKDMYLTHAIKYPVGDEKPMFVDGKRHLKEFFYDEVYIVQPDVIFLLDDWTVKLFEKTFRFELKDSYDEKYILPIRLQKHQLGYETYIIPLATLNDENSIEEIKSLIDKIKIDWKFVHLHCHNSFSLKDGIGTPDTRIDWHAKRRKPAIATTNHGNIHDWITIYEGAKKNNMKPLLGMEAYFNRRADELEEVINVDSKENVAKRKLLRKYNSHVTMFCKNEKGFHNLVKIHNDAWVNRFYHSPIVSPRVVAENNEGLIVLSGCSSAEQNQIILQKHRLMSENRETERKSEARDKVMIMKQLFKTKRDDKFLDEDNFDEWDFAYFYEHQNEELDPKAYYELAIEHLKEVDEKFIQEADKKIDEIIDWWHEILGENYFLEIMVLDYEPQKIVNQELIKISQRKGIPLVLTNDAHYLTRSDSEIQRLMMLSDQDKTFFDLETQEQIGGSKIWTIKSREMYYKSVDELYNAWKEWHESEIFSEDIFWEAVNGALLVQDKIENFEIDSSPKLPKLYENSKQILVKKLAEGMKKLGFVGNKEYEERLKFELKVISDKGFIDYFLIMEDITSWAKNNFGVNSVGAGRGSAAGSLVNYVLGITGVDPIKHDLLFERFLDIKREDAVDIDTDFEPRIRDKVLQYMAETYGSENVAPIGTFGLLKTRSAILDTARVLGIPPQETMAVTTKLPKDLDEDAPLQQLEDTYQPLKKYLDTHTTEQHPMRVYVNAIKGSQRNASMHACGVLLTSNKLMENVALMKTKKGIVTGWVEGAGGRELSDFGYYKYDILGLMNLQVINDAVDLIKKRRGIDIDITQIEINDESVYKDIVHNRDNYGVFQFESPLAYRTIDMIKPDNFNELSDISALLRPGPLKMKMPEEYARRKHGKQDENGQVWSPEEIPECIRWILSPTYGILVYQEQFMQIAEAIGGMDKGVTNLLRKLIIKYGQVSQDDPAYIKNMKGLHDQFIENASKPENLGTKVAAEEMWELMAAFSGYGFNKCIYSKETVQDKERGIITLEEVDRLISNGEEVWIKSSDGNADIWVEVNDVHHNGQKELVEVELEDGKKIRCTLDHKFATSEGMMPLNKIIEKDLEISVDLLWHYQKKSVQESTARMQEKELKNSEKD